MMRFGSELTTGEKKTFNQVKKIVNLRKSHTALRYGDYYTLQADSNIYAYIRSDLNERLLVVLNKSNETQRVDLTIPCYYNLESLTDLISQQKIPSERDAVSVIVEAVGWKVFRINNILD
jgi:glycosidase